MDAEKLKAVTEMLERGLTVDQVIGFRAFRAGVRAKRMGWEPINPYTEHDKDFLEGFYSKEP